MAGQNKSNNREVPGSNGGGVDFANAMTLRAYAAHRGCTLSAVQVAIQGGRLERSLVWGEFRGSPAARIADVALADQEWDANTDHSQRHHGAEGPKQPAAPSVETGPGPRVLPAAKPKTQTHHGGVDPEAALEQDDAHNPDHVLNSDLSRKDIDRIKEYWAAKTVKLKYEQAAGELIPVADVERGWLAIVNTSRTRVLGIPSKAKQKLPHLSPADMAVLDSIVREALEELCETKPLQ